jgi:Ca2+-binding RTX toxin-like protein
MSAAYTSTTDFTVAQELQATDQDGLWLSRNGSDPAPNLTIDGAGEVAALASINYTGAAIYGVRTIGDFTGAAINMDFQSRLYVEENDSPPYALGDLAGYGIASTASPNLTISGNILVAVSGQATAILAPFSSGAGSVIIKQGGVEAVSNNGSAYAVRMESGGAFQNLVGSVEVHAGAVAYGVLINGDGGSFYNNGTITAGGEGAAGGYGIAVDWESASVAGTGGSFVNDGMIEGDYALVAKASVVDPAAVQVFTNNVALVGKVDLGDAPAQLLNNGRIDGQVTFGASNDLYDGHAGNVSGSVLGGGGDDTLLGGANVETLLGADGNDWIDGGGGADVLDGGTGINTLFFKSAAAGVSVDLAAGVATTGAATETIRNFQQVIGTDQADTLSGSSGADTILGAGGANYVRGGDGGDSIVGGADFNNINGNKGDDTIVGHSATGDWLLGGQGDDQIDASASTGHNIVNGNLGSDTLIGGNYGDTLRGGQGDDLIHGGSGNDLLFGDLGANTMTGGAGADTFHGASGVAHDVITDFHQAEGDHVQIAAGLTYTISQLNGDVEIDVSNGAVIVLKNTQLSSLSAGWLVQA